MQTHSAWSCWAKWKHCLSFPWTSFFVARGCIQRLLLWARGTGVNEWSLVCTVHVCCLVVWGDRNKILSDWAVCVSVSSQPLPSSFFTSPSQWVKRQQGGGSWTCLCLTSYRMSSLSTERGCALVRLVQTLVLMETAASRFPPALPAAAVQGFCCVMAAAAAGLTSPGPGCCRTGGCWLGMEQEGSLNTCYSGLCEIHAAANM